MRLFVVSVLCLALTLREVKGQSCTVSDTSDCYYTDIATITPTRSTPSEYVVIGGLFDVHHRGEDAITCASEMSEIGMVSLLAFFWGINHYANQLTTNQVSIGALAFDNCMRPEQTIENLLGFAQCKFHIQSVHQTNVVAYIGPYSDLDVKMSAQLATDIGVTLVTPGADAVDLHVENTNVLRIAPSFEYELNAIVAFLTHSNINTGYLIVLYEDHDPFWHAAYMSLWEKLEATDLCVVLYANMDDHVNDIDAFVDGELKQAVNQKWVVPLMTRDTLSMLLNAVRDNDEVYGNLRFVLNSHIGEDLNYMISFADSVRDAIVLSQTVSDEVEDDLAAFMTYLNTGAVDVIPNLDNAWLDEYKNDHELPSLEGNSNLRDAAAHTLLGVKAVIEGIAAALRDCALGNELFCDKYRSEPGNDNLMYRLIRDTAGIFDVSTGELKSSETEIKYLHYKNPNGADVLYEEVGTFSGGVATMTSDLQAVDTYGDSFESPDCLEEERCCFVITTPAPTDPPAVDTTPMPTMPPTEEPMYSMVKYKHDEYITGAYPHQQEEQEDDWISRFDDGDHKWIIALGVLAGFGILCVVVFEVYILFKLIGTRYARQWRTMLLGQLLLLGILLSYMVCFAYLFTPTKETCGITRFGVGVCYAICFAVLLVKLMVILTSKTSEVVLPGEESPNYLKGSYQFLMFIFAVGVQVVIDVQWLILVPPDVVKVVTNNGDHAWVCNHYTWEASKGMFDMEEFVRTNFENHVLSLVYIMMLILITTILSLHAHGIITNHRESVFIGIASGFSIPIWLAWTLVGGLNIDDDYAQEIGDACIAFGLLATATIILFSMFLPKVRQLVNMGEEGIYVEDDRDTYYAGSVIMAPSSYKKGPPSVIYVNNQGTGIYSEPVVIGNGDPNANHIRHPGSTYSAPTTFAKRPESTRVLKMSDDLKGRHPYSVKRPQSETGYSASGRPRSQKGTLSRSGSSHLGAL